ncbi:sensor histidine kinase, partial [Nostoc piscinale]|uniref:sensor histidine kinase n=1 Tax=Nostoc piscinale TaxID=224012 RepID=UPI0039A76196
VEECLRQKAQDLEKTLKELQYTQAHLIQSEKMSSIGQLVAGVAHEINNPTSFIYSNIQPATEYIKNLLDLIGLYQQYYPHPEKLIQDHIKTIDLEFLIADLPRLLSSMKIGAERISQIVLSLRNFSRMDEAECKAVDIHSGIDSTLVILTHRLKAQHNRPAIAVIKEYGNLPLVECYPGHLNQVFMNILVNALDALEERDQKRSLAQIQENPSSIRIQTFVSNTKHIIIRFIDNGPGIPENLLKRLFDPFFTTKPVGVGTGLGLSISYQIIVNKHKGKLTCLSTPEQGAEFQIEIPIHLGLS